MVLFCRSHFELPPPSELVVPLLDLGLRCWPRPPSNTPPLDLALSIARTDPPLGLVRLLACRRRSSAPSSTVSSLRNLTERFLEISRRRVFIGDDAREVAPSSRDARAFLGAASPAAGAGRVLPSLALALPQPRSPSSSTSTTASASASRSAGRDGARHDRARLRLPLQGVTRRRRGLPRGHGRPRGVAAPVGGGPAVSDVHVIACVARSLVWAT